MPRRRRTAARKLTLDQQWELSGLGWGGQCTNPFHRPPRHCDGIGCWSRFESDEEREETYWAHRDELIRTSNAGVRPYAFWVYEAPTICRHKPPCPMPPNRHAEKVKWLEAHGLLTAQELTN
jgi:hypothetical protein